MANSVMRAPDQNSPKSSPRGSRSPAFIPRENTTGTLRTTISLTGKIPSVSRPFYLMKDLPDPDNLTGSTNLIKHYGLENSFTKFSGKKVKEELSAFLPNLPGNIDIPSTSDASSLRALIEKPPICGKEILTFTSTQLSGFRLHPGPLPEKYRQMVHAIPLKKKKRKEKYKEREEGGGDGYTPSKGVSSAGSGNTGVASSATGVNRSTGISTPTCTGASSVNVSNSVTSAGMRQAGAVPTTPAAAPISSAGANVASVTSGGSHMNTTTCGANNIINDSSLCHDRKHKRQRPKDEFEDKKKRKKKEKKRKKEKHHSPDHHSETSRDKFT